MRMPSFSRRDPPVRGQCAKAVKTRKDSSSSASNNWAQEIKGIEAQQASKLDEVALVQQEHDKVKALAEKRIIDNSRVYTTDRELARLKGELGEIDAGIARAKVRMSEIRSRSSPSTKRRGPKRNRN